MKSLLLILFAITLCFSAYAASDSRTGVWTAELQDDGTLQMTIFHGQNENRRGAGIGSLMGFDEPLRSYSGLSKGDITSAAANVPTAEHMIWDFKRRLYCAAQRLPLAACTDLSDPALRERLQQHFDSQGDFPPPGADDVRVSTLTSADIPGSSRSTPGWAGSKTIFTGSR